MIRDDSTTDIDADRSFRPGEFPSISTRMLAKQHAGMRREVGGTSGLSMTSDIVGTSANNPAAIADRTRSQA